LAGNTQQQPLGLRAAAAANSAAPHTKKKPTSDEHAAALRREHTAAAMRPLAATGYTPEFDQAATMVAFPPAVHDALALDALLSPDERAVRLKVRAFMEAEVAPVIADYWERAEFPFQLVPKLGALKLGGATLQGHGCPGLSIMANAMAVLEMSRVDASVATFALVHNFLALLTVGLLGSEEQKAALLPGMADYSTVGCWALTEPSNGSDASGMASTATRVPGGWKLNGRKRWIGNGTWADVLVVWARDTGSGHVNAFVLKKGAPGLTTTKIENKIALRCVQNADIHMADVFVPDAMRLPGAASFADTNKVLALSRVMVGWMPVGMAMGAYDMAARYAAQRRQFGAPLASFQLVQEKLGRMLAATQAMFLMSWRLTVLAAEGKMSHEQASLVKAANTLRGREVVALGRELLGGNGILAEFLLAKAFSDMEAIYSYEGTYEVNMLVLGRGETGISAIKPHPRAATARAKRG
jgi:acyl-CoA oxidase